VKSFARRENGTVKFPEIQISQSDDGSGERQLYNSIFDDNGNAREPASMHLMHERESPTQQVRRAAWESLTFLVPPFMLIRDPLAAS
jgi:hypothetical protein